jgi:hypothetical protein
MSFDRNFVALIVVALAAAGAASGATVAPPPNLGELGASSEAVVLARAGSSGTEAGAVIPRTVTHFAVIEQLSGPRLEPDFDVVEPGGVVDGVASLVPGAPVYREGETYLLFLGRRDDGRWRSTMLAWGLLRRAERAGIDVLEPVPEVRHISVVSGGHVEPPAAYRTGPLVEHLRQVVREGRPWRPEAFRLDDLSPLTKAAPEGCTFMEWDTDDNGVRWFDFDRGVSTSVAATTPGQEGIADGGAGGVERGAAAWTDHAASNILLEYSGVVDQEITCDPDNDNDSQSHAVVFNDPCDDIEPLINCSGTLAFGGPQFLISTRQFDQEPWHPAVDLFVIVNDGAQCLGETKLEEVITHEIGHGLGFGHYGSRGTATMYAYCCAGWGASLGPKDEECATYLYPPVGAQPPLAPSGLMATPVDATRIDLAWTDRSGNESAFAIYRDLGQGPAEIATVKADQTTYADTTLTPCTSASYYVVARNEAGDSGPSNTEIAATGGDSPAVPTGLSATAVGSSRVDLAWSNGGVVQTGVRVWRAVGSGGFSQLVTLPGTAASYSDSDLTPGVEHSYRVQGVNHCGTSAYSATVSVTPDSSAPQLELGDGRFRVEVVWQASPTGPTGLGQPVALTDDTGYFWFFNPDNVEMVLKLLDGCNVNGRYWVFAGGLTNVEVDITVIDTATGDRMTYANPVGTPFQPIQDTAAFATCDAAAKGWAPERLAAEVHSFDRTLAALTPATASAGEASACAGDPTSLCLNDDRFSVSVGWQTAQGSSGQGQAVQLTSDTGYFWFFNPDNVEMVVKVLRACGVNGYYWVFAGGLTDVEVEMTVVDTATGDVRSYTNPLGTPFAPLQDTEAFADCP